MRKSIYVGNLAYDTNENEVRELFMHYGLVHSVKLIRDYQTEQFRGFGFVDMELDEANRAIANLNGTDFLGRELRVKNATKQPDQKKTDQKRLHNRKQIASEDPFEKEQANLRANLTLSRRNNNKKYERINLNKLGVLCRKHAYYEKALEYFQQAFKIEPEDRYTLDGFGMTYFEMEQYDQAIEWFKRQLDPIVALTNLSRTYRAKEDYDRAIEYAQQILRKDPENQIALNQLGINYRKKGKYEQSIKWFQKCLEINPRQKLAMDGLAITYRKMGDYEQAIAWFEKELELHLDNKQAMNGLGITYGQMRDYEKSIYWFNKELKLDPNAKEAMNGLGITYREMEDYKQAIAWFEKELALYPDSIHGMNGLAITYRRMKNYQESIEWFENALKLKPNNQQCLNGLGITYQEMGKYEQALACFEKILASYPNNQHGMNGVAITYQQMGNYAQAIALFNKMLPLYRNDALKGLETTYDKMGPTSEAVELLKHNLLSEPTDSLAYPQLSVISQKYESDGKLQEAKQILAFLRKIKGTLSPPNIGGFAKREGAEAMNDSTESLEQKIKRLEKEIERREVELLRSRQMATLGVMASGLAHEIMQPLQIILATAQNCQLDIEANMIETPEILEDLEGIAKTTKRIDHIVNHLHVLSRPPKPTVALLNINTVIKDAFIMFGEQLKSRNISLKMKYTDHLPSVQGDKIQLEQVFINLINNSRDALEQTERDEKQIRVSTQVQDDEIHIRFEDNGAGISPEDLPHIFDAFMTTKERGVGVGLYITQDIIHSYGGAIMADSRANEGTTFLIKLPIVREEEDAK